MTDTHPPTMIDPDDKPMYYAYAYRSGVVRVGCRVPEAAVKIAEHPSQSTLCHAISMFAIASDDGRSYIYPGISEATDGVQAYSATAHLAGYLYLHLT